MKIQKDLFDIILDLTSDNQAAMLVQSGFNLTSDADEYLGKILDETDWLNPDSDSLMRFFEGTEDNPEMRMKEYRETGELSEEERTSYREYLAEEALENERHPSLFGGNLSCGRRQLLVIVERVGGGWDCEASFAGVFTNLDDAIRKLGGPKAQIV